jgi:hypothetical protein
MTVHFACGAGGAAKTVPEMVANTGEYRLDNE